MRSMSRIFVIPKHGTNPIDLGDTEGLKSIQRLLYSPELDIYTEFSFQLTTQSSFVISSKDFWDFWCKTCTKGYALVVFMRVISVVFGTSYCTYQKSNCLSYVLELIPRGSSKLQIVSWYYLFILCIWGSITWTFHDTINWPLPLFWSTIAPIPAVRPSKILHC